MNGQSRAPWDGTERRQTLSEDRISLMIEESVSEALGKSESRIMAHFDVKAGQFHTALQKMITDAFPGGDLRRHHDYHEREENDARRWEKLKAGIVENTLKGGAWALLVFIAMSIWEHVKALVAK